MQWGSNGSGWRPRPEVERWKLGRRPQVPRAPRGANDTSAGFGEAAAAGRLRRPRRLPSFAQRWVGDGRRKGDETIMPKLEIHFPDGRVSETELHPDSPLVIRSPPQCH